MTAKKRSSKQEGWILRFWRILAAWDDAINASPLETLEKRVVSLEQSVCGLHNHESPATKKRSG